MGDKAQPANPGEPDSMSDRHAVLEVPSLAYAALV